MGEPIYGDRTDIPDYLDGNIRFDFRDGCRMQLAADAHTPIRVRIYEDTANVLCLDRELKPGESCSTSKKYAIKWRMEVHKDDGLQFRHVLHLEDQPVLVQCPGIKSAAMGDTIAMMRALEDFHASTRCRLTVAMNRTYADLFRHTHPDIEFIPHTETALGHYYAEYRLGLFWGDDECNLAPIDHRLAGNYANYRNILGMYGLPPSNPPRIKLDYGRVIDEPYVCIAVQASAACKTWMGDNFHGWLKVVKWLREHGRRVLCIDKHPVYGTGLFHTFIPNGAEDYTGDLPLTERIALLRHADCFIGGSSGLAWLAWCAGCPVVLISGFTEDWNEFPTPYRVRFRPSCSGCWNDPRLKFDHKNILWCPRHQDDDARRFECSRLITSQLVIDTIEKTPAFASS